jgi:hypothetical protein
MRFSSNDYKTSSEYRERFAFNEGERYWMTEAFKHYKESIQKELQEMIDDGKRPFIHPSFFDQFFIDIENKMDCWTEKNQAGDNSTDY